MIDQLFKLIQQNAGDDIVKNPAIPNEHNDDAIQEVGNEIINGLKTNAQQGNFAGFATLLQGQNAASLASHPIVSTIIASVAAKFTSRFGVPQKEAHAAAGGLIPKVLSQFINKAQDPNDQEFNLQDVLKNFSGGGQLADVLSQFGGGKSGGLGGLGGLFGK